MEIKKNFISFYTISSKEIVRIFRIWPQTILPSAISMSLYLIIFGNLIGARIEKINGFSYMNFILPGIIMMSVITNSYANVVSSFFGAKFQKNIEEILISPTSNITLILGFLSGGLLRGLLVGLLVTIIALFFIDFSSIHSIGIVVSIIVLTSILFSLAGLLNGIFAKKFDDVSIFTTFILSPLIYLGGVFYSIHLLPNLWKQISLLNPILYMVNAFRYGFLGYSDINIFHAYFMLFIFIAILFTVCYFLIKKGYGLKS